MNQVTDRDGSAPWMLISDIILRCLVSKLHIQSKNLKCVKWWVIHTSFKQQTEFHSSCSDNFFPSFAVSLGVHGVCWLTGLEKVKSVELQLLPEPTQAQTLSSRTLFSKLALSRKAFMLWLHAAIPLPLSHLACFSFSIHSQEKLSAFRSKVWLWNKTYVNLKWVDFLCKNTQSIIWVSSCKVASSCAGPIENRTAMWSTDGAAYGWVKVWNDSKKNVKKKHIPFVQNLLFNKQNKRSVNPHLKRKKKKKKILITHLCDSFLGPRAVIVQVFFFFYSNLLLHHLKSIISVWGCCSSRGPEVAPEVLFSVMHRTGKLDSWSISKPLNDQLDHKRKKQKQLCQRMQVQTRGKCCGFHASASYTVRVTWNNANIQERFEVWRNFPPSSKT